MICPSCGAHCSDTASFCGLCLARFTEPERATSLGPVPQPVRAASAVEWAGKKCAYCMTELKSVDDVLLCGACGTPHHQDCWNENHGCATFGCLAADNASAMAPASSADGRSGVGGSTTVVATFGPTTLWLGRVITFENEVLTLQDHGPISAVDVLSYDRQGQLVWANDRMRAWVESMASAPRTARQGPSVIAAFAATTGWSGKVITFEDEVFTLQDYGQITASDVLTYDRQGHLIWADGGMRAWVESKADGALGSSQESTPAARPALVVEPTPVVEPRPVAEPMFAVELAPVVEKPAAAAPAQVDVRVVSLADEIARLAELHAKGILTDAEFTACKAKVMG